MLIEGLDNQGSTVVMYSTNALEYCIAGFTLLKVFTNKISMGFYFHTLVMLPIGYVLYRRNVSGINFSILAS